MRSIASEAPSTWARPRSPLVWRRSAIPRKAPARSEATRRGVIELGIADQVVETNAAAAKDADLVIVCIPVGASGPVAAEIAPVLKPGAIVSDVGSVKAQVLKDMAPHIPPGVN